MISLLHCENHGCFLKISGKSIKQAANWRLSVHVRSLRTHFPLNGVTGSEFIALRMRKCAQSANVSSQTSSIKKTRPVRAELVTTNSVAGYSKKRTIVNTIDFRVAGPSPTKSIPGYATGFRYVDLKMIYQGPQKFTGPRPVWAQVY